MAETLKLKKEDGGIKADNKEDLNERIIWKNQNENVIMVF